MIVASSMIGAARAAAAMSAEVKESEMRRMRRTTAVVCAPVPPPWHGSSYAVKLLLDSPLAQAVDLVHVNTVFASSVADLGRPGIRKLWRLLKYMRELVVTCKKCRPAFIIVTPAFTLLPFLKDSVTVLVAALLTDAEIILWSHSNDALLLYERSGALLRVYMRFVIRRAAHIVTVGESLRRHFVPFVGEQRVTAIPNGLPAGASKQRSPSKRLEVIYLSNMMKAKGWLVLLEAARALCARRDDIAFTFYGSESADSSRQEIEREFARNESGGRIRYCGPVVGEAKEAALAAADVFCLPTSYPTEALPISILEAMRHGLAVVSTSVGAISEVLVDGQGGAVVPSNDVSALVDQLDALATNPARVREMGRFNEHRFRTRFSIDIVAERWKQLIHHLEVEGAC